MNILPASKTVVAQAAEFSATNTHRCCAERNLIEKMVRQAMKKGVHKDAIVRYVRRKMGGHLVVQRFLHDNTPARSVPCVLCRRVLEFYDLCVTCFVCKDSIFEGKLTDPESPESTFTSGQRRAMTFLRKDSRSSSSSLVGSADE